MILKNVTPLQNLDPFEAAVSILLDFIEKQIITNILKLPAVEFSLYNGYLCLNNSEEDIIVFYLQKC